MERGVVAEGVKGTHTRARRRITRRRLRLLWGAAIVAIAIYLYYRPLASYVDTRRDLAARRAEVETLRQVREELRLRLASSNSEESTEREARRLGYVKPGEQLFVVKGIPAWRRAREATRGGSHP